MGYLDFLPSPSNIKHQRVAGVMTVKESMVSLTRASSVEAGQADIKSCRVILNFVSL